MRRAAGLSFLIGILLTASAFAGHPEYLFAQAVAKYQQADYSAAVELNERLLKETGVESAAVYFNLGNSYFKQSKLGPAMLNYLRAQRLAPRDADIKANLVFSRQAVEQYESEKQQKEVSRWVAPFMSLSVGEFKWLTAFVWMLTGLIFLGLLYGGWPMKRVLLFTGASLVACIYVTAAFISYLSDNHGRSVAIKPADARFEPSEQATVYFKVPEGAEIKALHSNGDWLKVQRTDGRTGWVPSAAVGEI
ncbi:MAG: SH3 domain-containing protein [Candidatus Omnitrophica bacterium]|nr:SH3 domain-containing protein [Candidatus Omnitrophota bacterium]